MSHIDQSLLAVPCRGLGSLSLSKLSSCLRVEHALPGKNNYSRDWRVLAELVLPHEKLLVLMRSEDPVRETLQAWPREATVVQLISVLEAIERFDVIDDCIDVILADCRDYERRRSFWGSEPSFLRGTNFQAFVIHALENTDFVKEMAHRLENEGISLFVPARDLPAAMNDYLFTLLDIMERRCQKIIVVISGALVNDNDSTALLQKAESLHAQDKSSTARLIPVIIEDCPTVGSVIRGVSKVNFIVEQTRDWAWQRLLNALKS